MKKKNVIKGVIISVLAVISIGLTFVIKEKVSVTKPNEETTIIQKGIKIKMLSVNDNAYGEKDQTFSYSFSPVNATNQKMETILKYSDNSDCSSVMKYAIDEINHQITLSCKGPFSKQIHFVLTSKENSNAKATIVLDYVKKIKNLLIKQDHLAVVNDYDEWSPASYQRIYDFQLSNFYDVDYTESTKQTGTFAIKMNLQSIEVIENTTLLSQTYTDNFTQLLNLKLTKMISTNYGLLSSNDLWNVALTNADKSALKAITKEDINNERGYLKFNISMMIYSVSGKKSTKGIVQLTYFMYGNYTGEVGVDSLESEVNTIDF